MKCETWKFGDIVENGWASDDNPRKIGVVVKMGIRRGRLNPGKFLEVTDTTGRFWELPLDANSRLTRIGRYPDDWCGEHKPKENGDAD